MPRFRETGVSLAGAPCNHLRPPCSPLFGSLLSQVGSPVGKPLKILGFPAALFCRLSLYFSLLPGSAARRRPVPPDCVRPADALIRRLRRVPNRVGEPAGDPLQIRENAVAPLIPQLGDRIREDPVVADEPDSWTRGAQPPFWGWSAWSDLRSSHDSFHPPGCAISLRNASAMRSPEVSASKARTNLPPGSMT